VRCYTVAHKFLDVLKKKYQNSNVLDFGFRGEQLFTVKTDQKYVVLSYEVHILALLLHWCT
jgi:hypothetical protein